MSWRTNLTKQNVINAIREGGTELIVFDFETTGLNFRSVNKSGNPCTPDLPIQLGAIRCKIILEEEKVVLQELDTFNKYFNIHKPLPPKITEVTGITDAILEKGEEEKDVYEAWKKFSAGVDIFSGHNSNFDVGFMDAMAKRYGETFEPDFNLDTLEMARDLIPKSDIPNYKLGTIADLYGITAKFHDAFEDIRVTRIILEIFINEYIQNNDENVVKTPKEKPIVYRLNLWRGYKGEFRIYISTSHEDFFYDIKNKVWNKQQREGDQYSIEDIDMEYLRKQAFKKASETMDKPVLCEEDFAKWRPALIKPTIKKLNFWEYKDYQRIYVETEKAGDFYFDLKSKKWFAQKKAVVKYTIADIDVEHLEQEAFKMAGVSNIEDFCKWRPA